MREVEGEKQIKSNVHGKSIVITEANILCHLHLDDVKGIFSISNDKLFGELKNMGMKVL